VGQEKIIKSLLVSQFCSMHLSQAIYKCKPLQLSDKECKSHLVSKGYLIPTLKDGKIVSYSRSTYISGYGQNKLYHVRVHGDDQE